MEARFRLSLIKSWFAVDEAKASDEGEVSDEALDEDNASVSENDLSSILDSEAVVSVVLSPEL